MATYKEIKGVTIQTLDEDPVQNVGSWSSGADTNTNRYSATGYGLTNSAAGVVGGYDGSNPTANNEYYDGSSWSEQSDLNTARAYMGGSGSQTSALIFGGDARPANPTVPVTNVESWNGSAWSETTEMNTSVAEGYGAGISNSAIISAGGRITPYPTTTNQVESWNGSSWTEQTSMTNAAVKRPIAGTYTACLAINYNPPNNAVEQFNGSSWTEISDTNSYHLGGGAVGVTTDALAFSGPSTVNTETWNGSVWTEVNNLSTQRDVIAYNSQTTNSKSALAVGGSTPPGAALATTEEWEFPPPTAAILNEGDIFLSAGTKLKGFARIGGVPTGAWSSGGNAPVGRYGATGFGTQTDFLMMMGEPFSPGAEQCTYNGTAWAESVNFPGGNNTTLFGAGSSSTLGFVAGGYVGTAGNQTESYDWNGTAWTDASADLNTGRNAGNMNGASVTSTIYGGGSPPSSPPTAGKDQAETWNGTAWTEVSELNRSRYNMAGSGASDSNAFIAGGYGAPPSPNTNIADTETWNGTSWTEQAELNTGRSTNSGGGTNTLALVFGGGPTSPGRYAVTELWNGSTWTELADLSIGREYAPSASNTGAAVKGFASVGLTTLSPAFPTATEEWTADTTLSTITVS